MHPDSLLTTLLLASLTQAKPLLINPPHLPTIPGLPFTPLPTIGNLLPIPTTPRTSLPTTFIDPLTFILPPPLPTTSILASTPTIIVLPNLTTPTLNSIPNPPVIFTNPLAITTPTLPSATTPTLGPGGLLLTDLPPLVPVSTPTLTNLDDLTALLPADLLNELLPLLSSLLADLLPMTKPTLLPTTLPGLATTSLRPDLPLSLTVPLVDDPSFTTPTVLPATRSALTNFATVAGLTTFAKVTSPAAGIGTGSLLSVPTVLSLTLEDR